MKVSSSSSVSSSSASSAKESHAAKGVAASSSLKTENSGRAFVVLEDGNIHTWEEYSTFTGNGMRQNIFPKHDMSLVIPKKTQDVFHDHMQKHHAVYYQRNHDSFNIRCYTEPGIRKSFGNSHPSSFAFQGDEALQREKFYNYRCFDIKRWK